ncbi:MAG: hypothetical protein WBN40_05720 [Pseudomonadales bacterium]
MNLPDGQVLAAIDIGSNSIHLIVARLVQGSLQTVASYRERVQLALGMGTNGLLQEAAMQRGIDCLQTMGSMLKDAQPDKLRAVATFALREAKNRDEFIKRAEQVLGCTVEVISGREEARMIFLAIAHSQTLSAETLVVDIGGGSTELATGSGFEPGFRASCRMGCVSFSEQFFAESYSARNFSRAHRAALQALEKYLVHLHAREWQEVYATSGSAKALAQAVTQWGAMHDEVTLKQLLQLREEIITRGEVGWLTGLGIADNRIELVPGGLAIMIACMQCLGVKQLAYRDVALREGVLYEMIEQMRHPDIRLRSRQSMQSRYNVDIAQATRVADTVRELAVKLPADWLGPDRDAIDILVEAAQLHEVGLQISANGLQKHSAYVLENSDLPGYNQDQQYLLAALVRQHRKRIRSEDLPVLRHLGSAAYLRLLCILRLAVLLNITRWPVDLDAIDIETKKKREGFRLLTDSAWLAEQILLGADLEREAKYLDEHGIELSF